MAISVNVGGVNYSVAQTGERSWGDNTSDLLVALANASYLIQGGAIPLTSEAEFGATAGLKALWFSSRAANSADSGVIRLANLDDVNWRNAANSANLTLTVNGSDKLLFDGSEILDVDNTATVSNKTLDNSNSITVQDANLTIQDDGDNTKQLKVDASGITTATTRTLTAPDADGTIALTSDIPTVPVDSVFGRTGAVVANTNDYTWAQVDKTVSDIADITTKSHTSLTDVGTNTHAQIDSHIADTTTNPHAVDKTDVGLGNVDNTSDVDKPVSTAQQTEIDTKQDDLITTRGDVIRGGVTGAAERLGVGASGQVLTSDGTDVSWQNPTGGLTDPMTTRGDIIVRDATNTTARLAIGTTNQILKSDGTDISWEDPDNAAGGKNYILNPDAAIDATTGITNTATTGSWTVARTSTAAELPEESKGSAFKISGSGLTVGDTVEWAILATGIDDADGGVFGRAKVSVLDISTTVNGQYSIQVYNVTDSVYVGDEETITGTGTYYLDVPLVAANDYEFHLKAETASPSNIGISGVTIEPVSQTTAGVIGKWQSFTPTFVNGPGITVNSAIKRIVGTDLEISVQANINDNTGAASSFFFELPDSFNVDTNTFSSSNITICGNGFWFDSSAGSPNRFKSFIPTFFSGDGTNRVRFYRTDGTTRENYLGGAFAAPDQITFDIKVPVAELANAHTPLLSDVQYENARLVSKNTSTSVGTSSTTLAWDNVSKGALIESDTAYEIPTDGEYTIMTSFRLSSADFCNIQADTGSGYSNIAYLSVASATDCNGMITDTFSAGDKIRVQARVSSGSKTPSVASFSVIKVSDYSARSAGLPFGNARIYQGSDQTSIASNTLTKVNLNTKSFDSNALTDIVNGRFQVSQKGFYDLKGSVIVDTGANLSIREAVGYVYVNGVSVNEVVSVSSPVSAVVSKISIPLGDSLELEAGDVVEVYVNIQTTTGVLWNIRGGSKLSFATLARVY